MSRLFVCLATALLFWPLAASGALTGLEPKTVEAQGPDGARVSFTVLVLGGNDGSDGRPADTVTCTPPPGSLFPIGTTAVSCVGSEGSTGTLLLTVVDSTEPTFTLPRDFTVVTTSPSGAAVSFTATASDAVDGSVAVACTPPSGSTFALGTTAVACTATDAAGNTATGGFNVTVATTPPPPGNPDIIAEATGPDGARVTFNTGDSEDDDGRPGGGGCSPAPGSAFPLGDTTVFCPSGNFTISVVDTTPPALSLPANITTQNPAVTFTATATDIVDGSVTVTCTPPSGSTFALGTTTVHCSATDAHDNTASGSFTVRVTTDPEPPENPADITVEATSPGGAVVTFDLGLDDGGRPITCAPASGSTFPIGATPVTCSSGATFTVTVVDTMPPDITSVTVSPASIWPPNKKLVDVTVTVDAEDIADPALIVRIYAITCDEPIGATDAGITGLLTAKLRADRNAQGDGRVYTLHIEAIDASGNRSTATVTVTVPHDQGNNDATAPATRRRAMRG
ncbi:MAG TPA: HYR domain-containing protein [Thermoanaerobaculia bacterium]|nr:HYR domain-containing protein [Thermoanaerobaculia bacterium]